MKAAQATTVSRARSIAIWIVIGLLSAALNASSLGQWIERTIIREWVYPLRGIRTTPGDVVIVSMDRSAADLPAVTRGDRLWSRQLYSSVIDKLTAAQALAIILDVTFEDEGDEATDAALETSLRNSNRVVLFTRLSRTDQGDVPISPIPQFAAAARAQAVFALPKSPQVDSYWPFFPARHIDVGEGVYEDLPALPVVALQIRLLNDIGVRPFHRWLTAKAYGAADGADGSEPFSVDVSLLVSDLRAAISRNRRIEQSVPSLHAEKFEDDYPTLTPLRSMMQVYAHSGMVPLNFYGPPRTIRTIDHTAVLSQKPEDVQALHDAVSGKVVFVGHSSKRAVDQLDGIPTVYTRNGLDLSGVEVAATAYANLTDGSVLQQVPATVLVTIHVSLALIVAFLALHGGMIRAVIVTLLVATAYCFLAVWLFAHVYSQLPIGVPLLLLVPFTLFTSLLLRYFGTDRQAVSYRHGIEQLLPTRVLTDIESGDLRRAACEHLHGTCMITDIANYTHYSEEQGHERIADLSREYFALVMEEIYSSGGELFDVEGDGLTAFWGRPEEYPESGVIAASAAFRILRTVTLFNQRHPATPFETRIGLNTGWVETAYIGGRGNYRFCIIGDVANTSSRLEGLNKRLGTSLLASGSVVSDVEALLLRPVGTFLLKGKSRALEVFEILNFQTNATASECTLCRQFTKTLELIKCGQFEEAKGNLVDILRADGSDGPAHFYLELLQGRNSPDVQLEDHGVVRVFGK